MSYRRSSYQQNFHPHAIQIDRKSDQHRFPGGKIKENTRGNFSSRSHPTRSQGV